jgi:glutamine---fructose-6-phosphate transaminase (isomerizing)
MCGIVGYAGGQQALPILLAGLRRLEYRGYDSAGVAVLDGGEVQVVRKAGKLSALEQTLGGDDALTGVTGIGHTRWATHGQPTDRNAHPHLDCTGRVAVIHNGIIENFYTLRGQLEAEARDTAERLAGLVAAELG